MGNSGCFTPQNLMPNMFFPFHLRLSNPRCFPCQAAATPYRRCAIRVDPPLEVIGWRSCWNRLAGRRCSCPPARWDSPVGNAGTQTPGSQLVAIGGGPSCWVFFWKATFNGIKSPFRLRWMFSETCQPNGGEPKSYFPWQSSWLFFVGILNSYWLGLAWEL